MKILLNTKMKTSRFTASLVICSIYPTPQNKSSMAELYKNILRTTFKNIHYHISVLITSTILSNTLNAKRKKKTIKSPVLPTASSEQPFTWELHKCLRGSHLSPLVSFVNMQSCARIFCSIPNYCQWPIGGR